MNLTTVYLLLFLLDLRKKDKRKGLAKQECVERTVIKKNPHPDSKTKAGWKAMSNYVSKS